MGGETFTNRATGKDVQEAFDNAHNQACYNYGNSGYSGSLAEKDSYIVITPSAEFQDDESKVRFSEHLIDERDERVDDKWGPAGAIRLADNSSGLQVWLFFGWASA